MSAPTPVPGTAPEPPARPTAGDPPAGPDAGDAPAAAASGTPAGLPGESGGPAAPAGDAPAAPAAVDPEAEALLARLDPGVLYAPEQDMWVREDPGGELSVGPNHLVTLHGQFMLFTPRPVGTEVAFDASIGVMETGKTVVGVHAPVAGRIVATNPRVVADVSLVERDPYGAGWLVRIAPADPQGWRSGLMDAGAYAGWVRPRLGEKLVGPVDDEFGTGLDVDPHQGY